MKTILIGNGINISEFKIDGWDNFEEEVDNLFIERVENFPDNKYLNYFKDTLQKFKEPLLKVSLENKLNFMDLFGLIENYGGDNVKSYVWEQFNIMIRERLSGYALPETEYDNFTEIIKKIIEEKDDNEKSMNNFLEVMGNTPIFTALLQASMHYKTFKNIYIICIKDILFERYELKGKKYSDKRIKWLNKYSKVVSLNVDHVLNNSELTVDVSYPHGFFDYQRDIETNFELAEKLLLNHGVKRSEIKDLMFYAREMDPYRGIANKVIFSADSWEKNMIGSSIKTFEEETGFAGLLLDGIRTSIKDAMPDLNLRDSESNVEGYGAIRNSTDKDFVVYGVSIDNDEKIFQAIEFNRSIKRVHIFCSEIEKPSFEKLFKKTKIIFKDFSEWQSVY